MYIEGQSGGGSRHEGGSDTEFNHSHLRPGVDGKHPTEGTEEAALPDTEVVDETEDEDEDDETTNRLF